MIASKTVPLSQVLQIGQFEPAKVQREFQWQTSHVERLLNDLVAAFQRIGGDPGEEEPDDQVGDGEAAAEDDDASESADERRSIPVRSAREPARQVPDAYFLGSLILFNARGSNTFVVYDGLQRLASLNILLSLLRDTWSGIGSADAQAVRTLLFDAGRANTPRRLQFPTSGQTLASIVNQTTLQRRDLTDGDYRMREAVAFFHKQFERWSNDRRRAFLAFLQNRVQFTVTETDNHSVAYQMFVGANSRGLRLDVGDVLKGMLAEQVRRNGGTVEQVDACSKGWRDSQLRLRNGFNDLVHAVEVFKFRTDPQLLNGRRRVEQHTTGEKLQAFFGDATPPAIICDWVTGEFAAMARVFERARAHTKSDNSEAIDISFRQLSFLGWTEWHPLLLAIGLRYTNFDAPRFAAEVQQLKRACYLIELLGWSEGARRRKFMEAIEQLEAGLSPFRRNARGEIGSLYFYPRGNAVKAAKRALRAPLTSGEKRGAIVRWIETLHWGNRIPRSCTDDASVEHVLPIAAMGDWSSMFTDQERDECTNRIGNLCILDKEVNDAIGNKEWPSKKPEYEKVRHRFKGVDRVLDTSRALTGDEQRPWCAKAVDVLTEQLAEKAETALSLSLRQS